jgi:hypothetical protein
LLGDCACAAEKNFIKCAQVMSDSSFCLAACSHCGQHIEFPAEGIGAAVACPHCEQETILAQIVAENVDLSPKPDAGITAGELKEAMTGVVPRLRISVFYQFGLLLVTIFMVLLPVAYLAFVGSIAYPRQLKVPRRRSQRRA